MAHCGHTPMTHLLVPTCCVEADVHGPVTRQLFGTYFITSDAYQAELGARAFTHGGRGGAGFIASGHGVAGEEPEPLYLMKEDDASRSIDAPSNLHTEIQSP